MKTNLTKTVGMALMSMAFALGTTGAVHAELRIGTAKVDITPEQLPVLINGSMTSREVSEITTRVSARAIVLATDQERIAMVVVDSCMMPRGLLDEVKRVASAKSGIAASRIMISATHTHTAPSAMGALGTNADPNYVPVLKRRLVEAIVQASESLSPTQVGWGSTDAPEFTALRRWVRRPDRMDMDPFGNRTVRANMHAAKNLDNVVGESGPEDPQLAIVCFRSTVGEIQAVLANFSMHYFGDQNISADYFGRFCDQLESHLRAQQTGSQPLAIMSHGCSGDIWRRDYSPHAEGRSSGNERLDEEGLDEIEGYTKGLVARAERALAGAHYSQDSTLAMLQTEVPLKYRVPNAQRLEWAKSVTATLGDRLPETRPEIYAREQVYLDQLKDTKVILQAIRIGPIAIATTPTETYALTGLRLKHQSPFPKTIVIELANGGDGYVPPPEQHRLGGYNTWAARSAGLETEAEPKFVGRLLGMLERITNQPRRNYRQSRGELAETTLEAEPIAYLRLDELSGSVARNVVAGQPDGHIETGSLYFLDGDARAFTRDEPNRCLHVVDSRVRWAPQQQLGDFTVFLSFRSGMPMNARDVNGWLFSYDHSWGTSQTGLHLGVMKGGFLGLQVDDRRIVSRKATTTRWSWHRVCLRKRADSVAVFVDDAVQPVLTLDQPSLESASGQMFFGGRSDLEDCFEGRIDEIAIFDSALSTDDIAKLLGTLRPSGATP